MNKIDLNQIVEEIMEPCFINLLQPIEAFDIKVFDCIQGKGNSTRFLVLKTFHKADRVIFKFYIEVNDSNASYIDSCLPPWSFVSYQSAFRVAKFLSKSRLPKGVKRVIKIGNTP